MSRTTMLLASIIIGAMLWSAGCLVGHHYGLKEANATWQGKWDKHALADTAATAQAQAEQRAIEAMRNQTMTKVTQDAQHAIDQARTDAADAVATAGSLRGAVDQAVSRLADSQARIGACTDAASKAAARFTRVLADVLKSADRRAGILAEAADQSRVRGLACEAAYDGLTPINQPIE
jgi:hypothetical protein